MDNKELKEKTLKEKIISLLWRIISCIILWSILELITPGEISDTTLNLYIGVIIGYSLTILDNHCKK